MIEIGRRLFLATFILVLQTMLSASLTIPVEATPQVNILTHSGFLDHFGYYHVVGEVENVGNQTVGLVKVTATFYDSNDTIISTESTLTTISILLPGRKSPFVVTVIDETQATKIDHYSLDVTFIATEPLPLGLEISSASSYVDEAGYMHVVGEIKNIENETATYVKVVAAFYDDTGTVAATAFTFSDPNDINPGQKAPFEVILIYKSRVTLVASYSLTAESDQYAIIPELSTLIAWVVIIGVTTLLILLHAKKTNTHSMKLK